MRALQFFNRQQAVSLDTRFLRRLVRALLEKCLDRADYQLGVHFIGATEMARVNQTFLGHEGSTDVITFDHQKEVGTPQPAKRAAHNLFRFCGVRSAQRADPTKQLYGEIFISVDDALIYANRFRVPWQSEVTRYLVHGILHLEGFDDTKTAARRVMKRQENRLLKNLSAEFDLVKIDRTCR